MIAVLENEALIASWDANAQAWTEVVRSESIESRRLVTDQAILAAALALKPSRALDIGCGEGWLVRALTAAGIETTGVDGSQALIDAARAAGPTNYLCRDYQALTSDPTTIGNGYDLLIANFALLGEDLAPLLRALKSIARPYARLLIQTLHPHNLSGPYRDGWRQEDFSGFNGGSGGETSWTPMPWYFRTTGSWLALLQASGWRLESLAEPLHPLSERPASLLLQSMFD